MAPRILLRTATFTVPSAGSTRAGTGVRPSSGPQLQRATKGDSSSSAHPSSRSADRPGQSAAGFPRIRQYTCPLRDTRSVPVRRAHRSRSARPGRFLSDSQESFSRLFNWLPTLVRGGRQTHSTAAWNTMTWIIMAPLLVIALACAAIPVLYDSGTDH